MHCRILWLLVAGYVSIAGGQRQRHRRPPAYDDYYYYYDDLGPTGSEVSAPAAAAAAAPAEKDDDYDLTELVKAWKDYIKDKAASKRQRIPQPVIEYECPPKEESYRIPDEKQCDKFTECNIKGELKVMLCPDGLVFDIKSEHCDYPAKVNCTGRPDLQPAQPSKNCPRANGFFAFPANETCQKFWDCRQGKSYLQICPEGVIFDPAIDACTTPDQSNRPECAAGKFLGFECPKYKEDDILRFGNHERLPNPKNCQEYFSCLKSGRPRLGACPKKTVFSSKAGACADPATVPGCEDFWKDMEEEDDYYYG